MRKIFKVFPGRLTNAGYTAARIDNNKLRAYTRWEFLD